MWVPKLSVNVCTGPSWCAWRYLSNTWNKRLIKKKAPQTNMTRAGVWTGYEARDFNRYISVMKAPIPEHLCEPQNHTNRPSTILSDIGGIYRRERKVGKVVNRAARERIQVYPCTWYVCNQIHRCGSVSSPWLLPLPSLLPLCVGRLFFRWTTNHSMLFRVQS